MPSHEETNRFLQLVLLDEEVRASEEAAEIVRRVDLARIEALPEEDRDALLDSFRTALPHAPGPHGVEDEAHVIDERQLMAALAAVRRRIESDEGQFAPETRAILSRCDLWPTGGFESGQTRARDRGEEPSEA